MILGYQSFRRAVAWSSVTIAFAAGLLIGSVATIGIARVGVAKAAVAPTESAKAHPAVQLPVTSYRAEVLQVVDGDTFVARVHIWPGLETITKVRLRDIDAPEMRGHCEQEFAFANAARDKLIALLAEGEVSVAKIGLDKYGGRVLALASTRSTVDVSAALLAAGLARPYQGGRRESWCGLARN